MLFTSDRTVRGVMTKQYDQPEWEPLLELAAEHIHDFMWMFEVELESGLRLHAYKHIETRRYLHLDKEGRAFVYVWPDEIDTNDSGSYREVDPQRLLDLVLERRRPGRPHFHAEHAGIEASFDIASLHCIAGDLPPPVERMVKRWALLHQAELMANWTRARSRLPLVAVDPLR